MRPVLDLLHDAAKGRVGVDQRFVQSILDHGAAAASDVLAFSREPHDDDPILLDDLMVDLFRHWGTEEALDYFIEVVRRYPEEIDDQLVQALLPFGQRAVEPLLKLYEDVEEEEGSDVAFLLAGLRARDPRVLALLLERLEFDTADGAFLLGLYGDPAARPALEKLLAEIPAEASDSERDEPSAVELRREIQYALDQLNAPPAEYQPEATDFVSEYPKRALPEFDVLPEPDRLELLKSTEADVRAGAAASFFNNQVSPKAHQALLEIAKSDSDAKTRGKAWESLADATEDSSVRDAMLAALGDRARSVDERGGAAVGLHGVADQDSVGEAIEALYEEGGKARAKALEAMWRSLFRPYAKYFAPNLDNANLEIVRQALRGAGYFEQTAQAEKIASFFDREGAFESLREDALFAYALAMPGETTRGRVRGMFRKIEKIAALSDSEAELVEFALDERLKLHGLDPVFSAERLDEEESPEPEAAPAPKVGRNDLCPCGSGKKYKKCHGK